VLILTTGSVARRYGQVRAQIALAWRLNKLEIHAPVVGVAKITQLNQLVEATEVVLDPNEIEYLEGLY
jgi:aryl-alcohol dehydrogenase-like predicted oxidoreductase